MTRTTEENSTQKIKHGYFYILALSIFSAACFFASFYFTTETSSPVMKSVLPPTGGEIGPIQVTKENSVYKVEVTGKLNLYSSSTWGFIEGELLDANKNLLMGFGQEMWKERDSEGTYEDTTYDLSFTIAQKGNYYLNFTSEYPTPDAGNSIVVKVSAIEGNSHVHFVMGLIALALVFYFWWKLPKKYSGARKEKSGSKNETIPMLFWVGVIVLLIWLEATC